MQTTDTRYHAQARATLGGELGALADQLAPHQLNTLADEVVREVLENDRGFSEYVAQYVANITSSSVSDADRLRKLRSYADIMGGSDDTPSDGGYEPVTSHADHVTETQESGSLAHPDGLRTVRVCLTCSGEVLETIDPSDTVTHCTVTEYRAGNPETIGHTSYTAALEHAQGRMAVNGAGNSKTAIYTLEGGRTRWVETLGGIHENSSWSGGSAMDCPTCGEFVREGDDCTQGHYAQETTEESPAITLEVCTDCAHLLANGETPEGDPEFSLLEEWDGHVLALACEEDCEGSFSWSHCDGCGSTLGGDRHPAVLIATPSDDDQEQEEDDQLSEFVEEWPGLPLEVVTEFVEGHPGYSVDDIIYEGEFTSYAKLAESWVDDGVFGEVPDTLAPHIDYESIGRDLDCGGIYEIRHSFTGYYFSIG